MIGSRALMDPSSLSRAAAPIGLAPAPRSLGWALRLRLRLGTTAEAALAWLVLAFSAPFVMIFFVDGELITSLVMVGERDYVIGTLTGRRATHASENDDEIIALDFRYRVGGRDLRATSYTTDGLAECPQEGAPVHVEYLRRDPRRARIAGARQRKFSSWAAFVLLFPLLGVVGVVNVWRRGRGLQKLLEHGVLAIGELRERRTLPQVGEEAARDELRFVVRWRETSLFAGLRQAHPPEQRETEVCLTRPEGALTGPEVAFLIEPANPAGALPVEELETYVRFSERMQVGAKGPFLCAAIGLLCIVASTIALW